MYVFWVCLVATSSASFGTKCFAILVWFCYHPKHNYSSTKNHFILRIYRFQINSNRLNRANIILTSVQPCGRNQSIGCAVAWDTIARDSESNYPFYLVGQFHRICAGHLRCQIGSSLKKLSISVCSGSYCTCAIVGPRVYGNTLAT